MSYQHINVDKIYIIHYDNNIDRKKYIDEYLSNYDNIVEYCTFPSRNQLTDELINKYYNKNESILKMRSDTYGRSYFKDMSPSEIATAICHYITFQKAINEIDDSCLILEDDVIFGDNFVNFNHFLLNTPSDFDCIFIGSGANLHADGINSSNIAYRRINNVTRCTDSIIYKKSLLNKIVNKYPFFMQPIDWEMELILRELNSIVYWWEPTLVSQGSQIGIYNSNIR